MNNIDYLLGKLVTAGADRFLNNKSCMQGLVPTKIDPQLINWRQGHKSCGVRTSRI